MIFEDSLKVAVRELSGLTILLVEDHDDSREFLIALLEQLGAKALSAASAAEGFALLQLGRPHVIVSDLGLPDEDGFSLMRRIRKLAAADGGATPAIALTAFTTADDRAEALGAGYQIYLTKPVNLELFVESIVAMARQVLADQQPAALIAQRAADQSEGQR
jgi:CheY-like chemotaxis protein